MPNPRVAIVLGLIDRATKPLKALSGTAGATGRALAKMGDQAAASRKLDRLESKLNGSRRATGGLRRGLRELSGETRDAAAGTARLVRWQERLGRSAGRARTQLGRLGRALDARLSRPSRTPPRGGRGGFLPGLAGGIVGSAIFSGIGRAVRGLGGFVETASQFETLEASSSGIRCTDQSLRPARASCSCELNSDSSPLCVLMTRTLPPHMVSAAAALTTLAIASSLRQADSSHCGCILEEKGTCANLSQL